MLSKNIKESTRVAHQQLEKKVVLQLKAIRSKEDYANLLKCFYAYFHAVERQIAAFITPAVLPDYDQRRNSSFLKQDIEALGYSTDHLPPATAPAIPNVLAALGALYVMEGSIMGGGIIVQMLAKGGIEEGISFFSGYGEATGRMWGIFVGVMDQHATSEAEEAIAIAAANETFTRFGDVFETAAV